MDGGREEAERMEAEEDLRVEARGEELLYTPGQQRTVREGWYVA